MIVSSSPSSSSSCVEERCEAASDVGGDRDDAVALDDAHPVAGRDRADVALGVADGLRDLAGARPSSIASLISLGVVVRTDASGSYTMSAASASGMVRVGTTTTVFDVSASTCSATGMMFLLFGRITTWSALTCSTVSSSSAVDGFSVWPPVTMPCTLRLAKSSASPSPLQTATTAVVTGGRPAPARVGTCWPAMRRLAVGVLLGDLLEQVGHPDLLRATVEVERDLDRRADVVRVDVAVPEAVAADDDDRVADRTPALLERLDPVVDEIHEVHDLVPLLADVELARRRPTTDGRRHRTVPP